MPEVPAVPGLATSAATLVELVSQVFSSDGALARTVPDFEPRAGQAEMAAAVARVIEAGGVLLAEAGPSLGVRQGISSPPVSWTSAALCGCRLGRRIGWWLGVGEVTARFGATLRA